MDKLLELYYKKKTLKYLTEITKYNYLIKNLNSNIYLRNFNDYYTLLEVFGYELYQTSHIKSAQTIIDLGSHIGLSNLYFLIKYPSSKIISVESDPLNYKQLLKNISKYSNIIPYNYKISPNLDLMQSKINIDFLIKKHNIKQIDIIKINIEGDELFLFQNDCEWLKITKCLIIECHDRFVNGCCMMVLNKILNYKFDLFIQNNILIFYFFN